MSSYNELSAKAIAVASRLNRIEGLCGFKAAYIVQRLAARLGAPNDRVGTLALNEELNIHGALLPLGSIPKVRIGRDGRWYFGLRLIYGEPGRMGCLMETMIMAIQAQDEQVTRFSLGLLDDTECDVSSDAELDVYFDKLIGDTEGRLERNFAAGRRGIGFTT